MAFAPRIRRFLRNDDHGGATVEFVIVFPAFIMIFIMAFEAAMLLARQVMLDRAIDLVVRDIRLGTGVSITESAIRFRICSNTVVLPHCDATLSVEMTEVSSANYTLPRFDQPCVDARNVAGGGVVVRPLTWFEQTTPNMMIVLRTCYVVEPFFPTSQFGLALTRDSDGLLYMTSATAFSSEPVAGSASLPGS